MAIWKSYLEEICVCFAVQWTLVTSLCCQVNIFWNFAGYFIRSSFSSYAIFYAIYPNLCYFLFHIPSSSSIFFLNVMLQYITLTPSYANSSYAMFSGQSRGRISGYCCTFNGLVRENSNLISVYKFPVSDWKDFANWV